MSATEFEEPLELTGGSLNPADEGNPEDELAVEDPANELPLVGGKSSEESAQQRRLAEERRQLEEERRTLDAARKELEEARRNLEERHRLEVERKALEEARSQLEAQKKLAEEQQRKLDGERSRTPSAPPPPVSERNSEPLGFFGQTSHFHSWPPRGVSSSLPAYPAYSRDPALPACSSDLQASAPPLEWSELDGGDKFTSVKKPATLDFFDDGWEKRKVVSSVLPLPSRYPPVKEDIPIEPGTAFWQVCFKLEPPDGPPAPKKSFFDRLLSFGKEEPPLRKGPSRPYCGKNPSAPENPLFFVFVRCCLEAAFKVTLDALSERKLPPVFTPAVIQEIQKNSWKYCSTGNELPQLMTHLPPQYRLEPMTIRWIYILFQPVDAISVGAIKDWRPLYGKVDGRHALIQLHALIEMLETLQRAEFSRLNQISKIFYVNFLSALTGRRVNHDNFEETRCLAYREAIKTLSQFEEHYGLHDTLSISLSPTRAPS